MDKKRYEWFARVSSTGRWHYIRLPRALGKELHGAYCRVRIEVLEPPTKPPIE